MSFLLPSGDSGPTAAEILAKQREEASKRRQGIQNAALRDRQKGVNAQLLGNRNPSFKLPGQGGT